MSGIAGLVLSSAAPPPDPATLARLIDSLRHRGPRSAATRSSAASRSCTTGSRSSILPPWTSRCSLARSSATEQDVKVVLSGEGGDEIFAGYPRCHTAMGPWWRGGRAMRGRGSRCAGRPSTWRDGIVAAEAETLDTGRSRLGAKWQIGCHPVCS